MSWGLAESIDSAEIAKEICGRVYSGIPTTDLDTLVAETIAHKTTTHPDYGLLAARIEVSNLHKETHTFTMMECAGCNKKFYSYRTWKRHKCKGKTCKNTQ